jgi:hypothetical protein
MKKTGKAAANIRRAGNSNHPSLDGMIKQPPIEKTIEFVEWLRGTPSLDSWRHLPIELPRADK